MCNGKSAEKEFLLMQAKDLSAELAFTRSVCDNLKEQVIKQAMIFSTGHASHWGQGHSP